MNIQLKMEIEAIVGEISNIVLLEDQGCTSEVHKLSTISGLYLLKSSYETRYREWLRDEAIVLQEVNNKSSIPVPSFYGFVEESNSSHLIMSYEKGITLTTALELADSQQEKYSLIKSFGEFLQKLHSLEIDESEKENNNWLDHQLAKASMYAEQGKTDGSLQLLEKLKTNQPNTVKQTFIHGDCTTDNVLVSDGEVHMFIDVAGMAVGDPRYDISLAIRKFVNDEEYLQSFYDGYKHYRVSKEEYFYFKEGLYEFF